MDYGGAANIQSSNVTLCDNVVFQNNIGHYGGAIICYKQYDCYINVLLSEQYLHRTSAFSNNLAKNGGVLAITKSLLQVFKKVPFVHNVQ